MPFSVFHTVATSPDGITWTQRPLDTLGSLSAIAFGNGRFVAIGSGGVIVTSTDGIAWSHGPLMWGDFSGVAYGNGRFVTVGIVETWQGNRGTILTSVDGMTWNQTISEAYSLHGITYGNGQFVAVNGSMVMTSVDGVVWNRFNSGTPTSTSSQGLQHVVYADGQFVAVGELGAIATSSDGATWKPRISKTSNDLSGVAYGNGTFVVVGFAGTILQSGKVGPRLGPIQLLPGDLVQGTINGAAGQTYLVQASTDLTNWMTLTNVVSTNASAPFFDADATNFSRRFYRTLVPAQ